MKIPMKMRVSTYSTNTSAGAGASVVLQNITCSRVPPNYYVKIETLRFCAILKIPMISSSLLQGNKLLEATISYYIYR